MPRWLYVLVLALPAAWIAERIALAPLFVFIFAALALVPLAGLISVATETLADAVGERLGGLLNATFGNAAELIIGITALAAGLPNVVRASIAGSIIGNALLVLGTAMLVGGWRFGMQHFNARVAGQYATMLALAVVGLVIPSIVATIGSRAGSSTPALSATALHRVSIIVALVLLASYAAYIAFSVFGVRAERGEHGRAQRARPHQESDERKGHESDQRPERRDDPRRKSAAAEGRHGRKHSRGGGPTGNPLRDMRERGEEKGDERRGRPQKQERGGNWVMRLLGRLEGSLWGAAVALAVATALTAVASELLVGAIQPVAKEVGLGEFFIGLIVLPIAGNAAEHASAITAAMRDRMEISMAITAGSSIQVALLVAPVLVLVGWAIGSPLTLDFNSLELVIFALVAGLYALVSLDGESTWLEGAQLFAFYVIVAVSAFFVPT